MTGVRCLVCCCDTDIVSRKAKKMLGLSIFVRFLFPETVAKFSPVISYKQVQDKKQCYSVL